MEKASVAEKATNTGEYVYYPFYFMCRFTLVELFILQYFVGKFRSNHIIYW